MVDEVDADRDGFIIVVLWCGGVVVSGAPIPMPICARYVAPQVVDWYVEIYLKKEGTGPGAGYILQWLYATLLPLHRNGWYACACGACQTDMRSAHCVSAVICGLLRGY
ncbi:hypothetical protein BDZ94DRAFT_1264868 [Collybia nuda]|uniref:Uncharacterized protein n=1 Tax=Collybia nuda TaxID=64659 RepID=A0A9P5Y2B6_9AGAR|nr:hypothetical protein BDZ94DRAFT_1264868 [Collybia nuda]